MEPASSCRRTGKEECGGMLLANGAGREAPQSVAMWSHNHQMALPAQGRKVLHEEGDWHLGEAGSHSWCEFCRFVVISITLHRVSHTRAESSSCSCKKAAGAAPTFQIQAGRGVSSSNPSKTLPGHLLFIPSQPLTGSGKDLISWRDGAHSYFVTSNG